MAQGPLAKALSGGIGLATEAYAAHKRSKSPQPEPQQLQDPPTAPPSTLAPPPYDGQADSNSDSSLSGSDSPRADDDEDSWLLDETQAQLTTVPKPDPSLTAVKDIDGIVTAFTRLHPPPPTYTPDPIRTNPLLPHPVIIPQRRPGSKHRGFVRAYAPILANASITQSTFLDFLTGFDAAINNSGYFHAANLATAASVLSYTVAVAPSVVVHFSALAVHISIETGRRLYMSKSTNGYLEKMNESLFRPRGLYAMLMTYKPEKAGQAGEVVDVNAITTRAVAERAEGDRSKFRATSGKTKGASQMPEAAALVFPGIEEAGEEETQNAFKKATGFLGDYGDRRAQAKFKERNPETGQLNVGKEEKVEFASRFADPNHAVNQGGLVSLVSGGKVQGRRGRRAGGGLLERRRGGVQTDALGKQYRNSVLGSAKRGLSEDVMYLIVVDMPSEEELRECGRAEEGWRKKMGF